MESIKIENPYLDLTTTNKVSLLILAGGMGSRYKGQKQIDILSANNETLMEFALYDAIRVGIRKFVFVINDKFPSEYKERITNLLKARGCEVYFVEQTLEKFIPEKYLTKISGRTKPLGTAHAVWCAKEVIQEAFITMNADDFYGYKTFERAFQYIEKGKISHRKFAMCAFELKNTLSENGSVSRGICTVSDNKLTNVEEFTRIERVNNNIKGLNEALKPKSLKPDARISMNFWVLMPSFFKMAARELEVFLEKHQDLSKVEFYLPSVIDKGIQNKEISVQVLPTSEKWFGLTYPGDKARVMKALAVKKKNGFYPVNLWENNQEL